MAKKECAGRAKGAGQIPTMIIFRAQAAASKDMCITDFCPNGIAMSHLKLQSSKAWVQCHKSQRKGLGLWCYFHQCDLPFIPWTLLEANAETCMTSLHACHDLGFVTVCGGCNWSHTLTTSATPASMKSPREKLSKEGRHCFKTNTVKGCWSSLSCREKPRRQSNIVTKKFTYH